MAFGLSAHYPSPNSQGRNLTVDIVLLTGNQDNIYREVPSLTVRGGIVGRQAKCQFAMGGFAIIGGTEEKPPSIYVANQGKLAE